jgi:hypothetical protein
MRPFFQFLETMGLRSINGAEIGVAIGDNAADIISSFPIELLILVDSYPIYGSGSTKHTQTSAKAKALERFKNSDNVKYIHLDSIHASDLIEDGSLDFVYIDANHSEFSVTADIDAWFPKVKKGGIIGGHDFDSAEDTHGVYRAVCKWAIPNDYTVSFRQSDWWVLK